MAQIDFYFNLTEKKKLLKFIFDMDFEFILEKNYLSPSYTKLNKFSEIEKYLETNSIFYLIHDKFTIADLDLSSFIKEDKTFYYITPKYGGPCIDTYFNGIAEKKGEFSTNFIAHYPYYLVKGEKIEAPPMLKKMFLEIAKYIKKESVCWKFSKKSVWIGKENNAEFVSSKLFQTSLE